MPIARSLSHSRGIMQLAHSKPGHPIQSAPDDILRYIFEWTMTDSTDSGDPDSPPWVLGQVCTRWRAVSRGHPPLWARISIRLVPSTRGRQAPSGSGRTIEHLRLLLDLSKASLLHIDLHLPVQDAGVSTVLLPILREHTHRWAALRLRYAPAVCDDVQVPLHDPRSLYFIRALSGAPFPTLGSLAISFPPSSTWQTETLAATTVVFDAFRNATSLRSAVLDTESGVLPVPVGNLKQYQAPFNSSLVELPTLHRVENLRVCLNEFVLARWRQSNAYPTTWWDAEGLVCLETLELRLIGWNLQAELDTVYPQLLRQMVAPRLTTLELKLVDCETVARVFSDFPACALGRLETLKLDIVLSDGYAKVVASEDRRMFLRNARGVQTLWLGGLASLGWLEDLTLHQRRREFPLPHLKSLGLRADSVRLHGSSLLYTVQHRPMLKDVTVLMKGEVDDTPPTTFDEIEYKVRGYEWRGIKERVRVNYGIWKVR